MRIEQVQVWLDAGTSEALLDTNRYLLEHGRSNVFQPVFQEENVIVPQITTVDKIDHDGGYAVSVLKT